MSARVTQLVVAIDSKNNGKVSKLVDKMDVGEINMKSESGLSALEVACRSFNDKALNKLLSKDGIDVNIKGINGWTPLHMAATHNNCHAVSKIVNSPGVDVNAESIRGWRPLHCACLGNHHQIVEKLLACPGIQVNVNDEFSRTPIIFAAEGCHKEALKLMLDYPRVDIDVKEESGAGLEALTGRYSSGDEGSKVECLEMINSEKMKREKRLVKQEGSMAGGAHKADTDESQVNGAMEEKADNPGSSAAVRKVEYNSLCWSCSKTEVKLEKCEGCQKAEYCSKECWGLGDRLDRPRALVQEETLLGMREDWGEAVQVWRLSEGQILQQGMCRGGLGQAPEVLSPAAAGKK